MIAGKCKFLWFSTLDMFSNKSYDTINSIETNKKKCRIFSVDSPNQLCFNRMRENGVEKGTKKSSANLRAKEKPKPISDFQNKQIVIAFDTALINAIERIGIFKK